MLLKKIKLFIINLCSKDKFIGEEEINTKITEMYQILLDEFEKQRKADRRCHIIDVNVLPRDMKVVYKGRSGHVIKIENGVGKEREWNKKEGERMVFYDELWNEFKESDEDFSINKELRDDYIDSLNIFQKLFNKLLRSIRFYYCKKESYFNKLNEKNVNEYRQIIEKEWSEKFDEINRYT